MDRLLRRSGGLGILLLALLLPIFSAQAQTDCLVQAEIPVAECEALLDLYNSTNGPGWTTNTGWDQDNFPCSWTGISCSGGQVSNLILINNLLSGPLPASIGDLTAVEVLNLTLNSLTGNIPASIGNLVNMKSLRLSNNMLTGPLPVGISNMTGLVSLFMQDNLLDGTLPAALGTNLNPETIRLDENQFTGSIPPEYGMMNLVQTLRLDDNQLSGPIPPEIGNMNSLITLRLDMNQLTGTVPLPVAQVGAAALASCDFTGNDASLCMPDTPDYQILGDPICGLPLDANCQPLPVELIDFTALVDANRITLTWKTASETQNAGFEVETRHGIVETRHGASLRDAVWETLAFVDGRGTTTRPQTYTYHTRTLDPGRYQFRLRQIDFDGTAAFSPIIEALVPFPNSLQLSRPFPNPATDETTVHFSHPVSGPVTLSVYNVAGQLITHLHTGTLTANRAHRFTFDVRAWPSGMYVVRATGPTGQQEQAVFRTK